MIGGNTRARRNNETRGQALRSLIDTLTTYRVLRWSGTSADEDALADRVRAGTENADVVSSRYSNGQARHALLLDIDYPAWLVHSTTPNHFHLYIDVPGGIPHEDYMGLLKALARCGVIEHGYAEVSRKRGATFLRLPWVQKEGAS